MPDWEIFPWAIDFAPRPGPSAVCPQRTRLSQRFAAVKACGYAFNPVAPSRSALFGHQAIVCGPLSVPEFTVSRVISRAKRRGQLPSYRTTQETLDRDRSLETPKTLAGEFAGESAGESAVQRSQTHAINQLDTVSAGSTTYTTAATSLWRTLNDCSVHHVLYLLHIYRDRPQPHHTPTATTTASPDDRQPSTPHPTPDPKSSRPTRYTQTSRGPRQPCTRPRPRRSR